MVDIHCHILPGVDDGASSWEIAVKMCKMAAADGITHIVATPHANDEFRYDRDALSSILAQLSERTNGIPRLSMGCDFHLSYDNLKEAFRDPSRYTIEGTNYLLVELSDFSIPPSVNQSLDRLLSHGVTPVITHPERNPVLKKNPSRVLEWVAQGCLVQVTANSLTGRWGAESRATAEWLMKRRAVHVLATDAHGLQSRPPILSEARLEAERIVGKTEASALVSDNPHSIVTGRALQPI